MDIMHFLIYIIYLFDNFLILSYNIIQYQYLSTHHSIQQIDHDQ